MDTRVTKKRLSEMLQYDWIKIILVIVAAILAWEFIFTTTGVRITAGQNFKVYYYEVYGNIGDLNEFMGHVGLSYDVLQMSGEQLYGNTADTVLSARLSVEEGDVMFVDASVTPSEDETHAGDGRYDESFYYHVVDSYNLYDFIALLSDAESYLDGLKENGELSAAKIEAAFRKRMKRDNRYRKAAAIAEGVAAETEHLRLLDEEVAAFRWLVETYSSAGLFMPYRKFQYSYFVVEKESETSSYKQLYEEQEAKNYALDAGFIDEYRRDNTSISNLLMNEDDDSAEGVAITVFNFRSYQPDLQFETIIFINALVREYSTLYDAYERQNG